MPTFKLPLSGDVVQSINPFSAFFSPQGGQYGLINIHLGQSANPAIEQEVLSDVGTYGRQLGRIGDALEVLLDRLGPNVKLDAAEKAAIADFRDMMAKIGRIKKKHGKCKKTGVRSSP
jgi:hypothetical protein